MSKNFFSLTKNCAIFSYRDSVSQNYIFRELFLRRIQQSCHAIADEYIFKGQRLLKEPIYMYKWKGHTVKDTSLT